MFARRPWRRGWSRTVLAETQIAPRSPPGCPAARARDDVYGGIRDPVWEYVVDPRTAALCLERQRRPLCVVGHSHVQLLWGYEDAELVGGTVAAGATLAYGEGPFIVNPGSVGQPRDGDPRAGYVVLDTEAGTATWLRVDYDIRAAQDAIRDAGLPLRLAARLAEGR